MATQTTPDRQKILVTSSGYRIEFKHERGAWPRRFLIHGREKEVVSRRRTLCIVRKTDVGLVPAEPPVTGTAYCSPTDTFEAELGRQYSLREVLLQLNKKSPLGPELMRAYLTRPGSKPWRLDKHGHLVPKTGHLGTQQLDLVVTLANVVRLLAEVQRKARA